MKTVSWGPMVCAALVLNLTACGGSSKEPVTTTTSGVECPAGQSYDGQFCVAQASATPPSHPVDERPVEVPPTSSETPPKPVEAVVPVVPADAPPQPERAAPVDVSMAAAAAPLIQYLASAHIPAGARPFGAPFAGQFATGQVLEQRVQLAPGKCYTVVAAGTPPVEEVDLGLYAVAATPAGRQGAALAQDSDRGPQAVLGRKADCFKPSSEQTELVLVVSVTKGKGVAAAQVFEK